jgi:hypothetical protein
MAQDGKHIPTKEFIENYDSIFRKGKKNGTRNKSRNKKTKN